MDSSFRKSNDMPTKLPLVKRAFHACNQTQQNHLLSEIYGYSQEMREFLESRLLNLVDGKILIDAMQRETLGKVFHNPNPRIPDGRKVRGILARAKKLKANSETIMELERLAFEGFVEFLNEYGGGPESFEEMACDHLEAYLRLVKKISADEKSYLEEIEKIRQYLRKKRNMITDFTYGAFEEVTGFPV